MKDGRHHRCRSCTSVYNAEYAKRQKRRGVVVPENKFCPKCRETKPGGEFHRSARRPDGLSPYCRTCWSNYGRKSKYGITSEEFAARLEAQEGRCAICRDREAQVVDHCHTGGQVRGLLCTQCNTGLGYFRDNPDYLRAAIEYLRV